MIWRLRHTRLSVHDPWANRHLFCEGIAKDNTVPAAAAAAAAVVVSADAASSMISCGAGISAIRPRARRPHDHRSKSM